MPYCGWAAIAAPQEAYKSGRITSPGGLQVLAAYKSPRLTNPSGCCPWAAPRNATGEASMRHAPPLKPNCDLHTAPVPTAEKTNTSECLAASPNTTYVAT
eukprot:CAMPEP_0176088942 /NCGR_PEP_ID=MMETSP0120_2-20121206/44538_1 /TAXON_ID=160619 /ORGANISM="Kryptoperidinium foliaceum, Strain CCMP 1326" /LENGTH=99 /DNA_ID=CAMNT_0017422809 /DNA_START=223 /DNA_END=522 /DNA_ORIENTATION=+